MSLIGQRIKERRKALKMSQVSLAKAAGCSQTTISDLERGRNEDSKELKDIAKALGVTVEYLADASPPSFFAIDNRTAVRIPIISSIAAGQMCESPDLYHPGDADEWVQTFAKVSSRSYALRVHGDSMTNPHGLPSIPEGSIVVVDPEVAESPGDIVVVKIKGEDEATLKKLVKDGSQYYLKPLNPIYPLMPLTEKYIICGVAKQVIQEI